MYYSRAGLPYHDVNNSGHPFKKNAHLQCSVAFVFNFFNFNFFYFLFMFIVDVALLIVTVCESLPRSRLDILFNW